MPAKTNKPISNQKIQTLVLKFRQFLQDISMYPVSIEKISLPYRKERLFEMYLSYEHGKPQELVSLGWTDQTLNGVISAMAGICPNVSNSYFHSMITGVAVDLIEEQLLNKDAEDHQRGIVISLLDILNIENLTEKLQYAIKQAESSIKEYFVLVPVRGIKTLYDELNIGNAVLYSNSHKLVIEFLSNIKRHFSSDNAQFESASCYIGIEIYGEEHYAREEALAKAQQAIEILNINVSSSYHKPEWAKIELTQPIILRSQEQYSTYQSFTKDELFVINSKQKSIIEEYQALFNNKSQSDISKKILRSINWYSKAVDADSPEESFINLATALENLLIGNENNSGSIAQRLSERAAFLLEKDYEGRKKIAKDTSALYGERSKIVHSGKETSRKELMQLDNIVTRAIYEFLKSGFKTWQDFMNWVDKEKYSEKVQTSDS